MSKPSLKSKPARRSALAATIALLILIPSAIHVSGGRGEPSEDESHEHTHDKWQDADEPKQGAPLLALAASSTPRPAHIRLRDQGGALLFSTWGYEEGTLQHIDPAPSPAGLIHWAGPEGLVGTRPFWEPIVALFSLGPPNTTIELRNYTVPPTTLGQVRMPRTIELPISGTLSYEEAERVLGKNLTAGTRLYFLAQIPIRITETSTTGVEYAFDLAEPATFNVTRSVGLQARAEPDPSAGIVRFTFTAPEGDFTAHNNCALATRYLAPGYYVVQEGSEHELVLGHYINEVERVIEGTKIDLEVTFLDAALSIAPSTSTISER